MVLFDILLYFYVKQVLQKEVMFMHQALYRKWRPSTFSTVVGQDHITSVLSYQAAEKKLSHAYLFCGSRGTGKTSCAKILAKAANCMHLANGEPCNECESCRAIDAGTSLDVLEMDAASNTGVDYIRDIRDEVVFTPSEMSTRVYIIDEVHMLSEGAFNALLKTLEEPPTNVIFILATTELQKIPATIVSRCQRFDFRRISANDIVARLEFIAKEEGIGLDGDAARLIAKLSQGGMRDAVSLLELCAGEGIHVTAGIVADKAGVVGREKVISVVSMIAERNYAGIFESVAQVYRSSRDISVFLSDILMLYRDMMVIRAMKITDSRSADPDIIDLSDSEFIEVRALAEKFRYPTMVYHTGLLREAIASSGRGADKRVTAEMTLIRMCSGAAGDSNEALSARIDSLEEKLMKGAFTASPRESEPVKSEEPEPEKEGNNTVGVKEEPKVERIEYGNFIEVLSQFKKSDASSEPFLKNSAAYREGNILVIESDNDFAITMLEKNRADERLLAILRAEGEDFAKVVFRLVKTRKKQQSLLDELI